MRPASPVPVLDANGQVRDDVKEVLALPEGFESVDQRRYGRAVVELIVSANVLA